MRECFARQHLLARGSVIDKNSFDGGSLRQVLFLKALIGIHIGVVGARSVIETILNELKAGNADRVERLVVCAAGVAHGDGGHAKIPERLHPLGEDRSDRGVLLQINTANASTPVIEIEVCRELLIIGLGLHRSGRLAVELGELKLIWLIRSRNKSKVVLYIVVGAEFALFFPRPKADADGAFWLHLQCVQDAYHLHGDYRAGAVVGGAGG